MERFNHKSALLLKTCIDSGITNSHELANIMGNSAAETGDFKVMQEDVLYKSARNLIRQVHSADNRFTLDEINAAIKSQDPVLLATILYDKRPDIGNTEPGDGWKYLGRGFFQVTGRDNYQRFGEKAGVDLVNHPEIAADPILSAKLAVLYWKNSVPEAARLDVTLATEAINGKHNGLERRIAGAKRWAQTITPELVQDIQTGKISLDQLSFHGWEPLKDGKLQANERGMEIRELQHHLNDLAIADSNGHRLDPNGTFDKATQQAVATFQRQLGLPEKSPVIADTLKAAAFYAGAPEIMRRPLLKPQPELSDALQETPGRMPPGSPPSYRTEWMQRDADGSPNYLHESAAPAIPFKAVEDKSRANPSLAPTPQPTGLHASIAATSPSQSNSLDAMDSRGVLAATELNPVLSQLAQLQHQMAALQQRFRDTLPPSRDTSIQIDPGERASPSISEAHTLTATPLPTDRKHPDFPLFDAIRRQLPPGTSDEMAAHVTLQAKIGGVDCIDEFRHVTLHNGHAFVIGRTPGDDAKVDLSMAPPPLQETLQQTSVFDRQQGVQLAQMMEQQRQANERGGSGLSI